MSRVRENLTCAGLLQLWPGQRGAFANFRELTAQLDVRRRDNLYSLLLAWIRNFTHLFADALFSRHRGEALRAAGVTEGPGWR